MRTRRVGEIVLVGVVAVVFFASISRGASFGPKLKVQEAQEEKSKTIELTGILKNVPDGKYDLDIEVLDDDELLFSKVFQGVQVNEGFYSLKINIKEAGLEIDKSYGLRITVLGEEEIPVTEATLKVVPNQTFWAFEGEGGGVGIMGQQYNLTGNYPYPQALVSVTNNGTGYGVKSVSKGIGLYGEAQSAQGYGVQAKNASGGIALFSEGKAKVQGDLEVTGQASLTSVNLPDNSVGSNEIVNGSIVNVDIADNANIAASKIDRTGLNADLLDGNDSTKFAVLDAEGNMQVNGNLNVNGSVGVGTTTPSWKFEVKTGLSSGDGVGIGTPGGFPGLAFHDNSGDQQANIGVDQEDGSLHLWTGDSTQQLVLNSAGNVGIGTATPAEKLHIAAGHKTVFYVTDSGTGSRPDNTFNATLEGSGEDHSQLYLEARGGERPGALRAFYDSTNDVQQGWVGTIGNHNLGLGANEATHLIIDYNGQVGVGTFNPLARLHAVGGPGLDSLRLGFREDPELPDYEFALGPGTGTGNKRKFGIRDINSNSNLLIIDENGAVGIATEFPRGKLDVKTGLGNSDGVSVGTPGGYPGLTFWDNDGDQQAYMGIHQTDGSLHLWTDVGSSPDKFVLTRSGNVGIGTFFPNDKLEIAGGYLRVSNGIRFSTNTETYIQEDYGIVNKLSSSSSDMAFRVRNSSNVEILTAKADGTVGIGTVNPSGIGLGMGGGNINGRILGIESGDSNAIYLGNTTTGNKLGIFAENDGRGNFGSVGTVSNNAFSIKTNNQERITVMPTGKIGVGKTNPSVELDVNGTIKGNNVTAHYQDLAEWVLSSQKLESATVVVIDPENNNQVIASTQAYDSKVAGVVSAQPGFILGQGGEGQYMIAHTGRVKVKVDASYGAIEVGDLLVTSPVGGVAMKSQPIEIQGRKFHEPGTILGKALEPLKEGQGEILVLLSLQ